MEELIQTCLRTFCERRIKVLDKLDLKKVLKRKNPYLFRALGISSASEMVSQLLEAHVSSSDETIFGNVFFEPICKAVTDAPIAAAVGVDFAKETEATYEVISLKSGPNIHNSSQSHKQQDEFDKIQASLRATLRSMRKEYIPILGYGYGRVDKEPDGKWRHSKKAGQAFWSHVTGDPDFYLKMSRLMKDEPLKTRIRFKEAWDKAANRFIREFTEEFCGTDGSILWEKLTAFNSAAPKKSRE